MYASLHRVVIGLTALALSCSGLAQPPTSPGGRPIGVDANGNITPTEVNGQPLNWPETTTIDDKGVANVPDSLSQFSGGSYAFRDIAGLAAYEVDGRIDGVTAGAAAQDLYTTRVHAGAGTYVRSTTHFVADVDLTCTSVYSSTGFPATLVTPRHAIVANHTSGYGNGTILRFAPATGAAVERTISGSTQVGATDIRVVYLNEDVPSTITPCKVLTAVQERELALAPLVYLNQNQKAFIGEYTQGGAANFVIQNPATESRDPFFTALIVGDSSHPVFVILDGQACLLSTLYQASPTISQPSLAWNYDAINSAIAGLGTAYQLTNFGLTVSRISSALDEFAVVNSDPGNLASVTLDATEGTAITIKNSTGATIFKVDGGDGSVQTAGFRFVEDPDVPATALLLSAPGISAVRTVTFPDASGVLLLSTSALNGSNISSGTVAAARLGSGTANNDSYLRGDSTWATSDSVRTTLGLNVGDYPTFAGMLLTETADFEGINVNGTLLHGAGMYHNWGVTGGASGYGIRDSSGTMQFKNSGGSWTAFGTGAIADADYGDITVSGTGTVMTIDAGAVTLAKMANMATDSFLGRDTAGTGVPEVLSVSTARTVLGLNTSDDVEFNTLIIAGDGEVGGGFAVTGVLSGTDPIFRRPNATQAANAIDISKERGTKTSASNTYTFTFSDTPAAGQKFGLILTNGDATADAVTLPANVRSVARGGATLASFTLAGSAVVELSFVYDGTSYWLAGEPVTVNDLPTVSAAAGDFVSGFDTSGVVDAKFAISGTGDVAMTTSPNFTTPVLGTPTSVTLTNATGLPPAGVTGTAAILGANTFTGAQINSTTSLVSAPAEQLTGTWFTGGSATTTKPHLLVEPSGTTSTGWSTNGTGIGVNAVSGYTGNLIDAQIAGSARFKIDTTGSITIPASAYLIYGAGARILGASTTLTFYGTSSLNTAPLMRMGGTTNSFFGLSFDAVNGFSLKSAANTDTWNDNSTAGSGTVANRYLFGIAAPTLTATNASVTDTVASTVYIGGAPTASTNTTITTPYALNVAAGVTKLGGPVIKTGYTVGTLPSTAATGMVVGAEAYVTDATAPTYLGALTGGGAVTCPVFYNGAAWVSH